jgi:glycine betaine/choline ABC-type transport system substrate-binding protein
LNALEKRSAAWRCWNKSRRLRGVEDRVQRRGRLHADRRGGGRLTVKALPDASIRLAIIHTADRAIASSDLVPLEDPAGLLLASHAVPIASDKLDADAQEIINSISAALTPDGLVALNTQSIDDGSPPRPSRASSWLRTRSTER